MIYKTQDPKYGIDDFEPCLVNAATGEAIPLDEPIFIFRARDLHALDALWPYLDQCNIPAQRLAIRARIDDFVAFRKAHPERMKEPDTAPAPEAAS